VSAVVRSDDHNSIGACLAKSPGILARPVDLETGVGVL
jgi:hypothetical protein